MATTYRSEELDLVQGRLCVVLSALHHLHGHKPLPPGARTHTQKLQQATSTHTWTRTYTHSENETNGTTTLFMSYHNEIPDIQYVLGGNSTHTHTHTHAVYLSSIPFRSVSPVPPDQSSLANQPALAVCTALMRKMLWILYHTIRIDYAERISCQ